MVRARPIRALAIAAFLAIFLLILFTGNTTPNTAASSLRVPLPKFGDIPRFPSPLGPPTHKPAEQKNSSSGGLKWYSDWRWLNPFSSSVTLDEDRAVLPPLAPRPPVYTYYDPSTAKTDGEGEADRQLLLDWRRSWYAQGFRPMVLGPSEAKNNPLYEHFHLRALGAKGVLNDDLFKWMAWGSMDSGVFADWLAFPMARYDDDFLKNLRRGTDPNYILHLKELGSAVLAGDRKLVNDMLHYAFDNVELRDVNSVLELIPSEKIKTSKEKSIALYDERTVQLKYSAISREIEKNVVAGKQSLKELINAHSQTTFQNAYKELTILKPFPGYTTALVNPAQRLARLLQECASSPILKSCPPNMPRCIPCDNRRPNQAKASPNYRDDPGQFVIGISPHPLTLAMLLNKDSNDTLTFKQIRQSQRDAWLTNITSAIFDRPVDETMKIVNLKNTVAGEDSFRGLWFTDEIFPIDKGTHNLSPALLDSLDWIFGFVIPRKLASDDESRTARQADGQSGDEVDKQVGLIEKTRKTVTGTSSEDEELRAAVEAWNLADTEVWRFIQAYRYIFFPLCFRLC